ncbi:MAG TPA: leucyl aminopeptidase [Candidatus Babeliales bacterium]|jgi:leucyl aminopeptidase|nr:leucyl aminopeptidase [Candidatus Babeliales bacterium]
MIRCTVQKEIGKMPQAQAYGFIVSEGDLLTQTEPILEWYPHLEDLMRVRSFTGKKQQVLIVPVTVNDQQKELIFVGAGKPKDRGIIDIELYRRAIGTLVRQAHTVYASVVALIVPNGTLFGVSQAELIKQTIITTHMTSFMFDKFLTERDRSGELIELILCGEHIGSVHEIDAIIKNAEIIGTAVNKARWWVDMPPTHMTPPVLAEKAEKIAQKHNLKITIFGEQEIVDMGMGGIAAVSRGSDVDCRLVIMEYRVADKNAPTVAFVGKGITFDSGGLSLKPARSMETMKDDMSGAAAVIASMEALAQLKPAINIIGLAPLSENLPSGKATKPGDIIRFYNGKTAEVKNTDAEGRLILADALSYAVKHYKPDAIIDLATLTGACAHALGPFHCGMMSEHDELVARVQEASHYSGDRVWRLPLHDDYKTAIKSSLADICNIGNEKIMAGAITAAHFLQHFVDDIPWVHLDIAGTAFDVPDISYLRSGATGFGVRLLIDLAMNWQKSK